MLEHVDEVYSTKALFGRLDVIESTCNTIGYYSKGCLEGILSYKTAQPIALLIIMLSFVYFLLSLKYFLFYYTPKTAKRYNSGAKWVHNS